MYARFDLPPERTAICPWCGKEFVHCNLEQWAYMFSGKPYCRWNCMRAAERKDEEEKKLKKKKRVIEN